MLVSWSGTTNTTPLSFISGTPNTKTSEIKFPICLNFIHMTLLKISTMCIFIMNLLSLEQEMV